MRLRFQFEVLLCLFVSVGTIMGQKSSSEEHVKVVIVPREVGLATVAYQPDCPLEFENVKLLGGVSGGGISSYDLRNRGTKSIRAFTVGDSNGSTWGWDAKYRGPVGPGDLVPQEGERWIQVVPLTNELRQKLNLEGPMRGLVVLMVIRVEFTDGTVYDDEKTYKAMVAYMKELQVTHNVQEYLKRKPK